MNSRADPLLCPGHSRVHVDLRFFFVSQIFIGHALGQFQEGDQLELILRRKAIMKRNHTNCFILFLLAVLMTQLMQLASGQDGEETVLVANFVNGNDAVFDSRVYLFNSSQSAGEVTVRVFTLPLIGDTARELTTPPLSLVNSIRLRWH